MKLDAAIALSDAREIDAAPVIVDTMKGFIKQQGTQFCVYSHTHHDRSFGCYPSREEAEKRLAQLARFKNKDMETAGYGFQEKGAPKEVKVPKTPSRFTSPSLGSRVKGPGLSKTSPSIRQVQGGGPGSGCNPEAGQCGRKSKGGGYHLGDNRDYKTMGRKVNNALRYHAYRWKELMKQGMDRDAASHEAYQETRKLGNKGVAKALKQLEKRGIHATFDGEPMAGNMAHAHIEPITWFRPPSLRNSKPVPTDDPMEKDNRFMDVTKRKEAQKERMKLLKRSTPAGSNSNAIGQIPAHTTLIAPHQAVYSPYAFGAALRQRPAKTHGIHGKAKRTFVSYDRRGCI